MMATTVRVASFNCENLFARFEFKPNVDLDRISTDGWEINETLFEPNKPEARKITARAIKEANADIIAFQEVENLDVLKRFRNQYLGGFKSYPHAVLIEGNDPRLIDVAVLSREKFPIVSTRSHHHVKANATSRGFVFSRDCLEVDIEVGSQTLTLFVNHLKSMMGGRDQTHERRKLQSTWVKKLVNQRFGTDPGNNPFIVLGDLNDYLDSASDPDSGIRNLVKWNQVENVIERLPAAERWTHYWNGGNEYRQLDYLLVSKSLSSAVQSVEIIRGGLPTRATNYTGPRFPGVGTNDPKASDHCPIVVELKL
nr:endonuclease/exonuclease/phosphatase family protein [Pirellula staleyi]